MDSIEIPLATGVRVRRDSSGISTLRLLKFVEKSAKSKNSSRISPEFQWNSSGIPLGGGGQREVLEPRINFIKLVNSCHFHREMPSSVYLLGLVEYWQLKA